MIGQKNLLNKIEKQIKNDTFPHFCIIVGAQGSGKKTLANEIYKMFDEGVLMNYGISIFDVRQAINQSYAVSGTKTFILIADADKMSNEAKNALLKVTEEPPNDAYVIMTLEDLNNTLDTIKSRASVYMMENYTVEEIDQYYQSVAKDKSGSEERIIISDICETPGEVDSMISQGILTFYDYVQLVVDNIAEVTSANSFKIADKLALKADSEGFDLKMFFKTFMSICIKRMESEPMKYSYGVSITGKYLRQLGIRGVNKQMLVDAWILEIRKAW